MYLVHKVSDSLHESNIFKVHPLCFKDHFDAKTKAVMYYVQCSPLRCLCADTLQARGGGKEEAHLPRPWL